MGLGAQAYEARDVITKGRTREQVGDMLVRDQKWVPFPGYADRKAWDKLTGEHREAYIKQGEKRLKYAWPRVKATDYLEFERTGKRTTMDNTIRGNFMALADLLMAELAEGEGRFTDQIINGIYSFAEMTTWALSAHTGVQPSKRAIQAYDYPVIDLEAGDIASLLAWAHYFLRPELDKIDPEISRRIRHELKTRVLDPYLTVDSWWWDGSRNYKPGTQLNNWSPWCLSNILMTSMLVEDDADRYADTVWLTMEGVDKYLNYVNEDGACEEGPSYWGYAAGKALDYATLLKAATNGKIDITKQKQLRNMGEYIARSYVGDGWMVNFADAYPRGTADPWLAYRFGRDTDSNLLKSFAAEVKEADALPWNSQDFFRSLCALQVDPQLAKAKAIAKAEPFTNYPGTEVCYITTPDGLFFAAKGGNNEESHNHNDVGTFSLWADQFPIIIDAGVGTYTASTFGKERYKTWNLQSGWHNLPIVNGQEQMNGPKFRATNVKATKNHFETDIAGAYPKSAKVNSWLRSDDVSKRQVTIKDTYELQSVEAPNVVNFLTWGDVNVTTPGKVTIAVKGHRATLSYDPAQFTVKIEPRKLTDKAMTQNWGSQITRISMTDRNPKLSGSYSFTVTAEK